MDNDVQVSYANTLAEFREFLWPFFERQGFSFPEAFMAWQMNRLHNELCNIEGAILDDSEEL